MSIGLTIMNFALDAVAFAHPEAAPFIALAKKLEPQAEAIAPMIKDAFVEGPDAFAAAKAKAPNFFADLSKFAAGIKYGISAAEVGSVSDQDVIALTAHLVGIDPPGWAHEETIKWWTRDSAH